MIAGDRLSHVVASCAGLNAAARRVGAKQAGANFE
jgi:hypothetical protein